MSVITGETVTVDFATHTPSTWAATDADSTPTGTLVINGTDNAATVTVTNKTTGVYKAAVTLPTIAAGDEVQIRVAATVGAITGNAVVWSDDGITVRQTADHTAAIADLPTVAEFQARTLVSAGYFDPATDEVTTDSASREASKATGFATPTNITSASGVVLASTGLDQISAAEPTGKPTTFAGWVMWLVQCFRAGSLTATTKLVKTEAGATVTTQTVSDDGTTEELGPPT